VTAGLIVLGTLLLIAAALAVALLFVRRSARSARAMWVPRRELRIPREAIDSAHAGHGLAGKRTGGDLLHVRWRNAGDLDEAAWGVRDLGGWLAALRS